MSSVKGALVLALATAHAPTPQPTPNVSDVPYFSELGDGYINAVDGSPLKHTGRYFEIVTPPLNLTYAQVWWTTEPWGNLPFPPSIREQFDGKILAITGFETQVVRMDEHGKEQAVPCSDLYNHHWNLFLNGKDGEMSDTEAEMELQRHKNRGHVTSCWHEKGVAFTVTDDDILAQPTVPNVDACCEQCRATERCRFWNFALASNRCDLLASDAGGRARAAGHVSGGSSDRPVYEPLAEPPERAPIQQVLSEGNGNEHRGSFHGTPKAFPQLLHSPTSARLLHMSINTRNPSCHRCDPQAAPQPKISTSLMAGATEGWSGILECPCTDRVQRNATHINGWPYTSGCVPGGVLERTHNGICWAGGYLGGMTCCGTGTILLDKEQDEQYPVDTYFHKLRIYYEDYEPETMTNAFRLYWQTEEWQGEYMVPQCPAGTPPEECVFTITSNLTARDMLGGLTTPMDDNRLNCTLYNDPWCGEAAAVERDGGRFKLVSIAFHQHSPAVISGELWNSDTNELICRNEPLFGEETGAPLNEKGFAYGIPPCVWGTAEEGLPEPPILSLDTRLHVIAKYNNSLPHYGVMAMWQGRGGRL